MDRDIWKNLAEIRKIFEKQDDEYYNAYCMIGCAKYRDKSAVS